MARELPCPEQNDKVGLKIDYLAKCLAQALAPLGFKRKSRTLISESGSGVDSHWRIVNLQSGEYNQGASGIFYMNLALQFPDIQHTEAARPGKEWLAEHLGKVGDEYGALRTRLEQLVPEGHPLCGSEINVRADEDLPALADRLASALLQFGLPWLEQHGTVAAVRDFEGSASVADFDVRLAAALTLGDMPGAGRLLQARKPPWETAYPKYVEGLRRWLEPAGVDCSPLPAPGTPQTKDRGTQLMEAKIAAEGARLAERAAELAAQVDDQSPDPRTLAAAWQAEWAEWQARRSVEAKPMVDLRTGARVQALDAAGREAVLLALLQGLVVLEAQSRREHEPLRNQAQGFESDEQVAMLLRALLPTLEAPQRLPELFDTLHALQPRLLQDLVTARYPWGFDRLALWLTRQPQQPDLRRGMESWLQGLAVLMPARLDATERALAAWYARPLDPRSPSYAAQLEQREAYLAETASRDAAATRRRVSAYPEQSLAPDDKAAVRAWRRWLRHDPFSGRMPVQAESDDWGGPAMAAWRDAPSGLRAALGPVLQGWLERDVDAKPRSLAALPAQVAAVPQELQEPWRAWVLERLVALEHSDGTTEWATTRMRPGVGAVLGEDSENLLLGLLLWSWADRGLEDATVATAWQTVARAAWQRLPEHGARAPTVGRLSLRLLAGLGGPASESVQAWAATGADKRRAKAAAQAWAEPLPRPG